MCILYFRRHHDNTPALKDLLTNQSTKMEDQQFLSNASYNNSVYNNSHEDFHRRIDIAPKTALGIGMSSCGIIIILGNAFVIAAICINRKLRSVTNYFVLSLAVADLTLGVFVLPFSLMLQLENRWLFGQIFCNIWAAADVLCCTASILSLCAISVDRYIGVTKPLKHRVSLLKD